MKKGLLEKKDILNGEWIAFNKGKVVKKGISSFEVEKKTPEYIFVAKVNFEDEYPDPRSKRRY